MMGIGGKMGENGFIRPESRLEYEMELSDWIMATEIVILNQSDPHPV